MGISSGEVAFKWQFQISPIIFSGGIASQIPGGLMPLTAISSALQFAGGVTALGSAAVDLDSFFAYFQPLPGGTLIDQQIGMYPYANQVVAANAVIQQPLTISLAMICPVGAGGGYASKLATLSAVQAAFDQHNKSGGTYTVLTPFFPYTDCVMTAMTDASSTATKQPQNTYKIDFLKPLITLQAAAQAYNNLMSSIANGTAPATTGAAPPPAPIAPPVNPNATYPYGGST